MNKSEVNKIMAILEVAYPNWINKLDDEKLKVMVNMWTEMFAEDDANLVASSVKAIMITDPSPFPPTIGAIKQKMHQLSHPDEMTEQEAWNCVYKAICNSGYHAKKEWEKLPEVLKGLVTPETLQEYSQMGADEVNTVVSSNFMRSYKVRKEYVKQNNMLPNSMKAMLSNIAQKLQIGTTNE